MRTANPALRAETFTSVAETTSTGAMTIRGTANKTFVLLFLALASATYTWTQQGTRWQGLQCLAV